MAYSTVDDVDALIPDAIWDKDTSTEPTSAQVTNEIIPQIDGEIDSRLATRYQTPITGAVSLAVLKGISARMAAIRVWGTAFSGQTGEIVHPRDWDEGGRKLLEAIVAGRAELSDASGIGESSGSDVGAPDMTMRTLEADPLQEVDAQQMFPPGQVF